MTLTIVQLDPTEFRLRLPECLEVYGQAMNISPSTTNRRLSSWSLNVSQPYWQGFVVLEHSEPLKDTSDGTLVGVAYGYRCHPEQWWFQQIYQGLIRSGWKASAATSYLSNYFELSEIHMLPRVQGRGAGRQLLRAMLQDRQEDRVLLSTPEIVNENNHAWHLYRASGFTDLLRQFRFSVDPRLFGILQKELT